MTSLVYSLLPNNHLSGQKNSINPPGSNLEPNAWNYAQTRKIWVVQKQYRQLFDVFGLKCLKKLHYVISSQPISLSVYKGIKLWS